MSVADHPRARRSDRWVPAVAGAILCLFVAGFAGAALLSDMRGVSRVDLLDLDSIERRQTGQGLYAQHCASCHGASLSGGAAAALDSSGHAMWHPDADLFRMVSKGMRGPDGAVRMPAFLGPLSADDIVSVLSYVAASWPADVVASRRDPDWTFPAACTPGEPSS